MEAKFEVGKAYQLASASTINTGAVVLVHQIDPEVEMVRGRYYNLATGNHDSETQLFHYSELLPERIVDLATYRHPKPAEHLGQWLITYAKDFQQAGEIGLASLLSGFAAELAVTIGEGKRKTPLSQETLGQMIEKIASLKDYYIAEQDFDTAGIFRDCVKRLTQLKEQRLLAERAAS